MFLNEMSQHVQKDMIIDRGLKDCIVEALA